MFPGVDIEYPVKQTDELYGILINFLWLKFRNTEIRIIQ